MHTSDDGNGSSPSFWTSRYAIGLAVMGGVAAYFLLTEHLAHVVGALPYLLLLACPLTHVFMHGGRGHHHRHSHGNHEQDDQTNRGPKSPGASS